MNELTKMIEAIYDSSENHEECVERLSKFFLEEIKEVLVDFEFSQITKSLRSDYLKDGIKAMVDDYLKSKYKI